MHSDGSATKVKTLANRGDALLLCLYPSSYHWRQSKAAVAIVSAAAIKRWQSGNGGLVEGEGGYYSRRGGSRMNYKQKGDGIEGRHCCPTLPPPANEGWDPGWPWDLMLDTGWLEGGDMSLLERVSGERRKGSCTVNKDRGGFLLENFAKCAQCEHTSCGGGISMRTDVTC